MKEEKLYIGGTKYLQAAFMLAEEYGSKPLSWSFNEDTGVLTVVLESGPKVQGAEDGTPDPVQFRELSKAGLVRKPIPTMAKPDEVKPIKPPARKKAAGKKPPNGD